MTLAQQDSKLSAITMCVIHLDTMLQKYCPEEEKNPLVTQAFYSMGIVHHILDKLDSSFIQEERLKSVIEGLLDLLVIILPNIEKHEFKVNFGVWAMNKVRYLRAWREEECANYSKEEKRIAEKNDEEAVNYLKRKK